KLTYSAVFTFNSNFEIINEWFGRTVIHSNKRFTYDEAQEIIETRDNCKILTKEDGELNGAIIALDIIAKKLKKERLKDDSISFNKKEVKFSLDENGKPTGVYFKELKDSNNLIEEFMLLANRR